MHLPTNDRERAGDITHSPYQAVVSRDATRYHDDISGGFTDGTCLQREGISISREGVNMLTHRGYDSSTREGYSSRDGTSVPREGVHARDEMSVSVERWREVGLDRANSATDSSRL